MLGAWRRFFEPEDVVGIKVNCGGHPWVVSAPEIVAEVVRQLLAVGLRPPQIFIYERFQNQLDEVNYAPHLPEGVQIVAAESREPMLGQRRLRSGHLRRGRPLRRGGHPVQPDEPGVAAPDQDRQHPEHEGPRRHGRHRLPEEHRVRQLLQRRPHPLPRPIAHAIPSWAPWPRWSPCARGRFCRSWTACAACGTAGPFARTNRYVFQPRQILFGTDPVAIDRLLLDVIDDKRKAEGAISIWDRSPRYLKIDDGQARDQDPNVNIIIREPGHVEFAARLGLGVYDKAKLERAETSSCERAPPARSPCPLSTGRRTSRARRRCARPGSNGSRCRPGPRRRGAGRVSRSTPMGPAELAARATLPAPGILGQGRSRLGHAEPLGHRQRLAVPPREGGASTSTISRRGRRRSRRPKPSPTAPTRCSRSIPPISSRSAGCWPFSRSCRRPICQTVADFGVMDDGIAGHR